MAAPTEYVTIDNFSPGIMTKRLAGVPIGGGDAKTSGKTIGTVAPNGTAAPDGTYGCRADETGSLIPLPRPVRQDISDHGVYAYGWDTSDNYGRPGAAYLLDAQLGAPNIFEPDGNGGVPTPVNEAGNQPVNYLWCLAQKTAGGHTVDAVHGYTLNGESYELLDRRASFLYRRGVRNYTRAGGMAAADIPDLPSGILVKALTQDRLYGDTVTANLLFNPKFTAATMVAIVSSGVSNGSMDFARTMDPAEYGALYPASNGAVPEVIGPPFTSFTPGIRQQDPDTTIGPTIIGSYRTSMSNGLAYSTPAMQVGIISQRLDGWSAHIRDQGAKFAYQGVPEIITGATFHQGRLVMVSQHERATTQHYREGGSYLPASYWELIWYSDWLAPLQYWDPVTSTSPKDDKGNNLISGYGAGTPPDGLKTWGDYSALVASRFYYPLLPGEDITGRTGALGTVTNTQLILVKHEGGAILVSNDLDQPTQRRMPGVESTHGVTSHGVQTPLGFVYGSKTGVYAWSGGDTSQNLSPQMEGFFWDHTNGDPRERYTGPRGRFEYWEGMVFAPNNYFLDTQGGGWWRLELPYPTLGNAAVIPYNCYDVDEKGLLWAFPYKVTVPGDEPDYLFSNVAAVTYDVNRPRDKYAWQSQPIAETLDQALSFSNVEVVASGAYKYTMKVTLTGYEFRPDFTGATNDYTTVVTRVIEFGQVDQYPPVLRPVRFRKDIPAAHGAEDVGAFNAQYVTVKIEVAAVDPQYPAPMIHSIKLGHTPRAHTPRIGK